MKTILSGHAANVPVLVGSNLDEVRYWTEIEDLPVQTKPRAVLHGQVEAFAGSKVDDIIGAYVRHNPNYGEAVLQLETDLIWRIPAIRMLKCCANNSQYIYVPVYLSIDCLTCTLRLCTRDGAAICVRHDRRTRFRRIHGDGRRTVVN